MDNVSEIFISVASYRDPELIPTLKNMTESASDPQRLHVAICWQDNEDFSLFTNAGFVREQTRQAGEYEAVVYRYNGARISVISVHYYASRGACWARYQAETLFDGEDFFLQIDSHCRFLEGWDREMIAMWRQLTAKSAKPVLTAYPPPYQPDEDGPRATHVSRLLFREFVKDGGFPTLTARTINSEEPVRGSYLAGGFIFAAATFLQEVPNDPQIFFSGEEISMAVRAFSHGYDIYHPHKALIWHYYRRENCNKVWGDHNNDAKKEGTVDQAWWERDKVSKQRVRTLLGVEEELPAALGRYTYGTQRTLRQFEYQAGICFKTKTVLPEVIGPDRICYFADQPEDDAAWMARHVTYNKKTLKIAKSEFDETDPDTDHLHIGVYNQQNELLFKKKLTLDEAKKLRTAPEEDELTVILEFRTESQSLPANIRLCPWLHSSGWGTVTEKTW